MITKMFDHKSILHTFVFVTTCCFIHVTSLHEEGILGGHFAAPFQFIHQAAILGLHNLTSEPELLGGGVIISDKFILSAAHCFINSSNQVHMLSFLVRLGTIDLKMNDGFLLDINKIHFANFDPVTYKNDLAVVELESNLDLHSKTYLKKIWLPDPDESFSNRQGRIVGYGYSWTARHINSTSISQGGTDSKLKYVDVLILFDAVCIDLLGDSFDPVTQSCGVSQLARSRLFAGVCKLDGGNAIIIGGTVAAILSKHNPSCEDTTSSALYTRVPAYVTFINGVITEQFISPRIHSNRRFELEDIPLL